MSPFRQRSGSPSSSTAHTTPACRKCYQRKKKCDRGVPRCSNCVRSNHDCSYEPPLPEHRHRLAMARLQAENENQRQQIQELQQKLTSVPPVQTSPPVSFTSSITALPPTNIFFNLQEPTISERIVSQLLNTEIDVHRTAKSLVSQIAQQFGLTLTPMDGFSVSSAAIPPSPVSYRPSKLEAERMVDAYFEFGNCFQPIMDPELVSQDMEFLYPHGSNSPISIPDPLQPDVRIYRIFIILAIGSSLLPKGPSNPNTAGLRACALAHFPAALRADDITCLTCIVLFCIYSMTDSAPMDPYQTVGIAAKLAVVLGYHVDDAMLPWNTRETRKRIFWSIYCMDRSISSTLSRPLAIPEEGIQLSLPTNLPDLSGRHTTFMPTAALFRQVVLLRRLQGMVSSKIASALSVGCESDEMFVRLRNEIETWFDDLPTTSSPSSNTPRKHPYLEVNYHLLLVRMYSPSPFVPRPSQSGMSQLRQSASRVVEMYGAGTQEYRMRQNFITLSHIILACVALVYTIQEAEGDPVNRGLRTWKRAALQQLESTEKLLGSFCWHLVDSEQYTSQFTRLTRAIKDRLRESPPTEAQPDWLSSLDPSSTAVNLLDLANVLPWANQPFSNPDDGSGVFHDTLDVDDFLETFGLGAFPA